ncbi:alpha/beta fold hydrolase [Clostridium paridis]|uniref:Alpha/beta hydrolase n=1 Tax=Clostridium paridis TaxID=2803863 RepID=A0A937K1L7_9CLOT|nr:alpha/beta hydrolase [Clostridium paridis]MBL4930551.1 alpha/beta hydrolase [Clostridium paridis]
MSLYFKESGNKQGEIIIFIHGGGISGWMWEKQLEHFKDYYCIVPDLPEHGKTINSGEISIKNSAKLIVELVEKIAKGKKVNVVGHSLGAKIVIELLNSRPEIIDHAVIASALCRPIPFMKLTHKPVIYKLTVEMLKVNWILNFQVKQFKFPPDINSDYLKKDFQDMTPETLFRIYDEIYKHLNIPRELENIYVPTLVVAGGKEPKAMKQSVTDIINILPNAKGIIIKNGLHTYPWVMFDSFNEIIRAWLNNRSIKNEQFFEL